MIVNGWIHDLRKTLPSVLQQQLRDLVMTSCRRFLGRTTALVVPRRDITDALRDERLYEIEVPFSRRQMQWSFATVILGIRICTSLKKELRNFETAILGC
jgi:hypothetical protein